MKTKLVNNYFCGGKNDLGFVKTKQKNETKKTWKWNE